MDVSLEKMGNEFSYIKESLKDKIDLVCEDLMANKFARYQQVWKSFQKYFDTENLEDIIARKADRD